MYLELEHLHISSLEYRLTLHYIRDIRDNILISKQPDSDRVHTMPV